MKFIAILMVLAVSLMAYEFKDTSKFYYGLVQLGEKKWAYCPDDLVGVIAQRAKNINKINQVSGKAVVEATSRVEQYEYMKTAQKIDKQINDETEVLYNRYMNIASKIAEDMCDIRDSFNGFGPYKSKLSPEEVYQHLEEYFK